METPDGSKEVLKIDLLKTFKVIMLDKKLKQQDAAEILGMDKRPYNRLIQRNGDLKTDDIIKIAEGLNCDVKLSFTDKESGKEWKCDFYTETINKSSKSVDKS